MTIKNNFRVDVMVSGEAEDKGLEFLIRYGSQMEIFSLKEILKNELNISKEYDSDRIGFLQSLINEGHRLTEAAEGQGGEII